MAEVEEVTFTEKAAWLRTLTIEQSLAIFGELYRTAMVLQGNREPHPEIEARHIADAVAFRQLMARVAGRFPEGYPPHSMPQHGDSTFIR